MTDLLERMCAAVPRLQRWIDELHTQCRDQTVPVGEMEFRRLRRHFPSALLASTRVAEVADLPFPPLSKYGISEFGPVEHLPSPAISFGDIFFVYRGESSEATYFREMVHVVQWNTLGLRDFLLTYGLGVLHYGFAENPLEAIAWDLHARFEQRRAPARVAPVVVRHAIATRRAAAAILAGHGLEFEADTRIHPTVFGTVACDPVPLRFM